MVQAKITSAIRRLLTNIDISPLSAFHATIHNLLLKSGAIVAATCSMAGD